MTPAEEAEFIALWEQGVSYREFAQALGFPPGAVASRSTALVVQGKIQPMPRGGAYRSRRTRERAPEDRSPSTVHRPRSIVG
jgi:hypothetical protein